jgi:hypothetical protein
MASGVAIFISALIFGASLVFSLFLGESMSPGVVSHIIIPLVGVAVLFLSFAGSYLLIGDALRSK